MVMQIIGTGSCEKCDFRTSVVAADTEGSIYKKMAVQMSQHFHSRHE